MATSGNIAIGNYVRAIGTPDAVDPNNEFKFLKSDAKRGATSLVSFGSRQLTGVAPGAMTETSTNAVNGAQLYSVAKEAMRHSTVAAEPYTYDIIVTEGKNPDGSTQFNTTKDDYYVSLNQDLEGLSSAKFIEYEDPDFAPSVDANRSEINSNVVRFNNIRENLDSSLTAQGVYVNAAHNTASLQSTALTFNNSIDGNTSQFGTNGFSSQTQDGRHIEFSTNRIMAGNQQIHNVAKGVDDTDAVNMAQLKAIESKITNINSDVINQARSYTDAQVAKVGAGAAALAGLHPLEYNPNDKWSFGVGVGNYKNAKATALGAFYQPNDHTMFNIATTLGDSRNMVSLGANVKVGYQDPSLKISRFAMAQQIKDLQADNASLRADNEELRSEIKEIKAALQKLQ